MSAVCGKKRGGQGLVHIVGEKGLINVVPLHPLQPRQPGRVSNSLLKHFFTTLLIAA